MMKKPSTLTRDDYAIISAIGDRAVRELGVQKMGIVMDIACVHEDACRLDLKGLERASKLNFAHDICGILRYFDRDKHVLNDMWIPRCAVP